MYVVWFWQIRGAAQAKKIVLLFGGNANERSEHIEHSADIFEDGIASSPGLWLCSRSVPIQYPALACCSPAILKGVRVAFCVDGG